MHEKFDTKKRMSLLWAKEENKKEFGKSFDAVTVKDKYKVFWKCEFANPYCGLTKKSPERVYQALHVNGKVCSFCKGTEKEATILAKAKQEHIEKYWHTENNSELGYFPGNKAGSSNDKIYVKCEEHNWGLNEIKKQRCADFTKGHIACPMCNGKEATPENNLKVKYPEIAKYLHPKYNAELILPSSCKKYEFWCSKCGDYYLKEVRLKTTQNQGCPIHNTAYRFSKSERLLRLILKEIVGNFNKKNLNIKWKSGHPVEVDLYENSLQIGIEFDGYRHRAEEQVRRDQTKNEMLYKYRNIIGIVLFIRVRERRLPYLKYYENQEQIICENYRRDYKFLIPVTKQIITLINKRLKLNIRYYSSEEILQIIEKNIKDDQFIVGEK